MDTKSKKWTAHRAVKIASFILAIALCFTILNRINACDIRSGETRVSPEVVFIDLSTNQYFNEQHMSSALYYASQVAYFGSEAAIMNGDFLKWNEYSNAMSLTTPEGHRQYAWIDYYTFLPENWEDTYPVDEDSDIPFPSPSDSSDLTEPSETFEHPWYDNHPDMPEKRLQAEQSAIREQLYEFRHSQEYLLAVEGLVYHISNLSDIAEGSVVAEDNWFRLQPVYYIQDGDSPPESAYEYDYGFYTYSTYLRGYDHVAASNFKIFLAFTADVVSAQNRAYAAAQRGYITDLTIIAVSAVLLVALFVILLLGAGRKRGREGVHIALIDKPFLDISLAAVVGWGALAIFFTFEIGQTIWRYRSIAAMNILFAAVSVAVVTPLLLWLMSFAKRIKAGSFWRHTLIFFVPSRFVRFLKSLWAGFPLTAKVALIALISFFMLLFTGMLGFPQQGFLMVFSALVCTAVTTFFILRYARRIHTLEKAARQTSGGAYDVSIDVGKGELGSIANSINNISEGINTAVEQRMKSERLKTELITNVSHDIRTPLTSIITYTDLLKQEGLDCEKAEEYLDVLIQKSQRLKTLTDELFEAAKAASGNIEVNLAELDLVSLINQVLGELDGAIKSSGLDLRVSLPENLPVIADGKLVWRIMENLLSNVFRYSLPDSRVYLSVQQENDYVCLELKNISATELNIDPNELIDRFKRGDESRADGGSGLGLSIVQSFAVAQGGKFNITIDGDLFKASVYMRR